MMRVFWAAGLLGAALTVDMPQVRAADLDAPPRAYGTPYDDPRYGDIYRVPERRYAEPRYEDRRYAERHYDDRHYDDRGDNDPGYDEPRHGGPVYRGGRDDCNGCGPPPGPRFGRYSPRFDERNQYCLPKPELKQALLREGWSDFHDPDLRPDVAWLTARRPSGQLFRIQIDRCTGQVLNAVALGRPAPPWAFQARRHYWN